ncbi:MAG TPA: hypothetical protein VFQ15_03440, partial [Jiangellaceae bacterium]|nr:hypothetical protein [Jiangellaceae bacterium]
MNVPTPARTLLGAEPRIITAGVDLFAETLAAQAASTERVDWQPPVASSEDALLRVMADPRRAAANATAIERMLASTAELVDVRPAREALGLESGHFLHAGPPLTWDRASGPMRGALIGAMLFEGLATTPDEAEHRLAAGDGITFEPCHHRGAVG